MHKSLLLCVTLIAAGVTVALGGAKPAYSAATITVDCTADSGALAGALANANDGDTLAIQGTCKGTFQVAHDLTLAGTGGSTLDGQAADTVLTINSGKTVVVTDLTITGGLATSPFPGGENGGGIWNNGTLTLTNSTVSGNTTSFSGNGGGIYNPGTLTLINSTISGNTASFSGGGAGIWNNGTLTLTNSTVSGNSTNFGQGGGIYNFGGTLTISKSTVSDNTSGVGGGITNRSTVTLSDSTVSGNTARFGGNGGGIWNLGALTLSNSTVSGNTASLWFGSESGGGIYNLGTLTAENTTISANSAVIGGGLFAVSAVTLVNTIVGGQLAGGNCAGGGLISDGGYNLEDGASCGFGTANNSLPNTNPLLDPAGLRSNGGPTQTVALEPESPAVDAIPNGTNGCGTSLTIDQRGISRPQGSACDIGAYELEAAVLEVTGHGRFNTEGNGQVTFTLSNEKVTFERIRGQRFSFAGEVESVTGSQNEAALTGTGSWKGGSGYAFEVSVVDRGGWGRLEDTISVVIRDPAEAVVFTSFGPQVLKQGDISVTPANSG